ncbi:uncharacterized protein LACBIDRAFT_332173 [Laccaria bicolor S238N-H82]|uniref:Predicted protein n=1 Tax=Laccaria bicolor (strain S238N-H82 / ATCC MYA-4686) TaxID=486041 RepID=B0DRU3_LACBS|nr:uncharacterized protein LACBIDRAFT_332173 [Laccaria bicolor S238N-H82]EDR02669.1 predicted protein [Laccaria bicolor S238N-H82]|eukprot:XP_001886713.1 predicted protein [Laccaria bicolor S238N-H82]
MAFLAVEISCVPEREERKNLTGHDECSAPRARVKIIKNPGTLALRICRLARSSPHVALCYHTAATTKTTLCFSTELHLISSHDVFEEYKHKQVQAAHGGSRFQKISEFECAAKNRRNVRQLVRREFPPSLSRAFNFTVYPSSPSPPTSSQSRAFVDDGKPHNTLAAHAKSDTGHSQCLLLMTPLIEELPSSSDP